MVVVEDPDSLERFTAAQRPSDSLYAHLLGVDDVEVVLYFKIIEPDLWELGFRASHTSSVDVGKISATLGGGGHRKAAGATISGSLEQVRDSVLAKIQEVID